MGLAGAGWASVKVRAGWCQPVRLAEQLRWLWGSGTGRLVAPSIETVPGPRGHRSLLVLFLLTCLLPPPAVTLEPVRLCCNLRRKSGTFGRSRPLSEGGEVGLLPRWQGNLATLLGLSLASAGHPWALGLAEDLEARAT